MKSLLKSIVTWKLKWEAKILLARFKPEIVAVAGTTNKTLTREYIQKVLSTKFDVRTNARNYNTEIGLPLAILDLPTGKSSLGAWLKILWQGLFRALFQLRFPKMLVLELGVDRAGDMEYLLSIVKPRVAVITEIRPSFSADTNQLDVLAHEISLLVKQLPSQGAAILNAADERVKAMTAAAAVKTILVSEGVDSTMKAMLMARACGEFFEIEEDQIEQVLKS